MPTITSEALIVRKVSVNRDRTRQQAIKATGRARYADHKVVGAMPKVEAGEVELVFFKPDLSQRNGSISNGDIDKEYELRGLKPADPISVAAFNEMDPAFADEKPHGTHWKDVKGNWCHASFYRWCGQRRVRVDCSDGAWEGDWWFVGIRE